MFYLIYRSQLTSQMQKEALLALLTQSRIKNRHKNITGMLLHFENKFIQLLEGDETEVRQLYAVISTDTRHEQVTILKQGYADNRLFPDWSMSFRTVATEEVANEPAYKDIYTPKSAGALDLVSLFNLLRGKYKPNGQTNN